MRFVMFQAHTEMHDVGASNGYDFESVDMESDTDFVDRNE